MRKQAPVGGVVVATIGFLVAIGLRPISTGEIVAAYVLALTALALLMLMRIARTGDEWERTRSELELALTPRKRSRVRPAELVRTERDLMLSMTNAGELHTRLLPKLRAVAAARLAEGHDLDLRHAREMLDEETWELLRPDRPAPDDRGAPGLPMARIAALLDTVESL
jgi:hypothetical protein